MGATSSGHSTTKFMIMMPWGRVGSNLLFSNVGQVARQSRYRFANENLIAMKDGERQIEWARRFYGEVDRLDLVGSKQNILSVRRLDDLAGLLTEFGVRLIRMRRANLVRVAVSQLRAELYAERSLALTGVAAWGVKAAHEPLGPVALKPRRFLHAVARARQADGLLSGFSPSVATLDIEYREIQNGPDAITMRLCQWLGLTVDQTIEPTYVKATPDDLAIAVPNLDELRAALRVSALADLDPMFDD